MCYKYNTILCTVASSAGQSMSNNKQRNKVKNSNFAKGYKNITFGRVCTRVNTAAPSQQLLWNLETRTLPQERPQEPYLDNVSLKGTLFNF